MYILDLTIRNIRVFEETSLEFVHPETRAKDAPRLRNVNLLLGDNGAGKTSVLRAVALALIGEALQFSGFRPYRLLRQTREGTQKLAYVKMLVVDDGLDHAAPDSSPEVSVMLERRGDQELVRAMTPGAMGEALFDEHSPAFFLAGYGATRRVETSDRCARRRPSARGGPTRRSSRGAACLGTRAKAEIDEEDSEADARIATVRGEDDSEA